MDKQVGDAGSAAEGALSKEDITSILTAPRSNREREEVLKQEHIERSVVYLIATDRQWWMDHYEGLLQSLSGAIRGHAYETYSWKLRSSLLQAWGKISSLRNNQLIHSWLDVHWSELGSLLSLDLPEEWYITAISMLLSTPLDVPPLHVVSIVSHYTDVFETVLSRLMRTSATQKVAIRFFTTLAEHGYLRKVQLLDVMLLAGTISREAMEMLLVAARLEPRNVVNLLENYCQSILSKQELPPTLVNFIRQYLINLDVEYLNTDRTKELLQRLHQRNEEPMLHLPADLQAYVQGWCRIAELIAQSGLSKRWLCDAGSHMRNMPQLPPETQIKLTDILVPRLVELVFSEMDLSRVLDTMGQLLMGRGAGTIGPGLLLLEQMIARAGIVFGRERPPLRLVPYIKVVLEEAHYLPSPEKEEFIHRCLSGLMYSLDGGTLAMLKSNAGLWPLESQIEWKIFLTRYGLATIAEMAGESGRTTFTSQQSTIQSLTSFIGARENAHYPVALVNQQPISLEQLRKMYYIKAIYRQYDSFVQQHGVHRDQTRRKSGKVQGRENTQQLPQEALDDLINDVLIREGIAELLQQDSRLSLNFDPNSQLPPLLQGLKEFYGIRYAAWLSDHQLNDADVLFALRILLQRELFESYLQLQHKSLSSWLKERRRRTAIVMNIQWRE